MWHQIPVNTILMIFNMQLTVQVWHHLPTREFDPLDEYHVMQRALSRRKKRPIFGTCARPNISVQYQIKQYQYNLKYFQKVRFVVQVKFFIFYILAFLSCFVAKEL